jgi:epoxyqueuosine reductase
LDIASAIREKAESLGFAACGFSPAIRLDELEAPLREWVDSGKAGQMQYLARNQAVRIDPARLFEGAKTIISLAAGYYFPREDEGSQHPGISRYALGLDYHRVLKDRGLELLHWIGETFGPAGGRVFTDSAPLPEREWARRGGLGWIGRNGCLILPGKGSWFFLAEIVLDIEIAEDRPSVPDRCGTCTRCVEACPTDALAGDGSMDPRKCISYLTIEYHGDLPDEFRGRWHDWIFGCDICQEVCPWNRRPLESAIPEFRPEPGRQDGILSALRRGDEHAFNRMIKGSPMERAGWKEILRNFEFLADTDSAG